MPKIKLFFAGLCAVTLAALIYFAQSAATQSAPAYSTWNTTPNGAKLLFDGLNQAKIIQVTRQFKSIDIEKPRNATVFFLGVSAFLLDGEEAAYFNSMESAAQRGNNLIVVIPNESSYTFHSVDKEKTTLLKRWGVRFVSDKALFTAYPIVDKSWKPLPDIADTWQRSFGKGSIILVGNGQRLNNKGIATNAASRKLLYRLISQRPTAIFEEVHLGIQETGSIVGLARHYHLQGLMLSFILLAALFIWSRSVSFPPPSPPRQAPLLGSDSRSLLAELMSRHLKGQLIGVCISEWNRTRGSRSPISSSFEEKNPVAAYHLIQNIIQNRTQDKSLLPL